MKTSLRIVKGADGNVRGIQVKFTDRIGCKVRNVSLAFDVRAINVDCSDGESETIYSVYADCPVQNTDFDGHVVDHELNSLPHLLARLVGARCIDE